MNLVSLELGDKNLKSLERISKKLASPEGLRFSEEEYRIVKELKQHHGAQLQLDLFEQFFAKNIVLS